MSQPNDQGTKEGPYLLGLSADQANRRITIEGRILVGRDPAQCQLIIEQPVISKRHATLEVDAQGRVMLTDLGSSNGTFVNGQRIQQREIRDGDRIGFGPNGVVAFIFHAPAQAKQPGPQQPFYPPQQGYTPQQDYSPQPGLPPQTVNQPPPVVPPQPFYQPPPIAQPPMSPQSPAPPQYNAPPITPPQNPGDVETVVQPYSPTPQRAAGAIRINAPSDSAFGNGLMQMRVAPLPVVRLGRAPDNDIVLESPAVSRYHATLSYTNQAQPFITDLGSTNGTFVNGQQLTAPVFINPTDLIYIGGFLLNIEGRDIKQHNLGESRIAAFHLSKDAGGRTILKDISLAIYPREFIGLMGPSGCGKSTLMDALNGFRPATQGAVFINDLELYRNFNAVRRSIGYVPQRDILHETLTVARTLYYAARLRLPESTPPQELDRVVHEVIILVGLQEQRETQFRQLSGGQQKRLSLALELITKPSFIFLDEPTSPLDPVTTENMMVLFRRLADEGRIVIMVTHKFEKFETMHQVAMLTRGGRLAFFGPPQEALNYFGCQYPGEIYHKIEARDPDELSQTFQTSSQHQLYVAARMTEVQNLVQRAAPPPPVFQSPSAERRAGISQWKTLTRRYLEVKLKDKRNAISLLAQPVIVAIVVAIIFSNKNDGKTLFISAIISILFGTNNAVREIVGEFPIYARERLVNLKIPSYVFSKFAILSAISFIQCFLWVTILVIAGRLSGDDYFSLILILYLSFLAGTSVGLFISALVNSVEKALTALPLIVALQLVLSGFIVPLHDIESRQRGHVGGLGAMNVVAAIMPMRWTMEALAHDVSIEDQQAGFAISNQMSLDLDSPRLWVFIDILMLIFFTGLFLILTMWGLKRKDAL